MKIFLIVFIFSSLMNCKPKLEDSTIQNNSKNELKNSENINQNLSRVWMLVEFEKFSKDFLISKKAYLDLTKNNASMGCNSIGFNYKKKSVSEIEFSNLMRTEMACGAMQLEDNFLKTLPELNSFKINGHKLTLYNSKNEKMIFMAQDWD